MVDFIMKMRIFKYDEVLLEMSSRAELGKLPI